MPCPPPVDPWICWACASPGTCPPGVDDNPQLPAVPVAVRVAVPVTPLLLDPSRRAITVVSAPASTLPTSSKPETANKNPNNRVLTIRTNTLRQSATSEELPRLDSGPCKQRTPLEPVSTRMNRDIFGRYTPSEAHSLTAHAWRVSLNLAVEHHAGSRWLGGRAVKLIHFSIAAVGTSATLRDPRRPRAAKASTKWREAHGAAMPGTVAEGAIDGKANHGHLWGRWHGRSSTRRVPSSSAVDALPASSTSVWDVRSVPRQVPTPMMDVVVALAFAIGLGLVLMQPWGEDDREETASPAAFNPPGAVPDNSEYVQSQVLRSGDLKVGHWIRSTRGIDQLTLSLPPTPRHDDAGAKVESLRVVSDGETHVGPRAIGARGHLLLLRRRLQGARQLHSVPSSGAKQFGRGEGLAPSDLSRPGPHE